MDSLKDIFLKDIAKQIFPNNAPPECQYWTFLYRFNPDYYSCKGTEVAELATKIERVDIASGFAMHLKMVIEKIYGTYRDELQQDGIAKEALFPIKPGKPQTSPWQVAYQWLWDKKFYLWLQNYIWSNWKEKAITNGEWIQFEEIPQNEKRRIGGEIPIPIINNYLETETPFNLKLNFNCQGNYLLLFHRGIYAQGKTTQYLIIPSQYFAPNYQLVDSRTIIPQQGAKCGKYINFPVVGKEEFMGILVDRLLDLPWLSLDSVPPLWEWQGEHLEELWKELQKQDNWHVFYQDFEVIPKKKK